MLLRKYQINSTLRFYATLSALQLLCFNKNPDDGDGGGWNSERNRTNLLHQSENVFVDLFPEQSIFNQDDMNLRKILEESTFQSWQSHIARKSLVEDLIRFDRNDDNDRKITLYPLDIQNKTEEASNSNSQNSSSSSVSLSLSSYDSDRRPFSLLFQLPNDTRNFDSMAEYDGFGLADERKPSTSFNDFPTQDVFLDNSFYDIHLNTISSSSTSSSSLLPSSSSSLPSSSSSSSSHRKSKKNPLKKDAVLPNINRIRRQDIDFFNRFTREENETTAGAAAGTMREHETLAMMTNAIYKQDVDLGYTFSNYNPSFTMSSMSKPIDEAEKVEVIQNLNDTKIPDNNEHGIDIGYLLSLSSSNVTGGSDNANVTSHQKLLKIDEDRKLAEILYEQDIDLGYILSPTGSKESSSSSKISDKPAEKISSDKEDSNDVSDLWAGIPFKIDNETGEYIRLPFEDIFKDFIPIDENDQKDDLPKVKEPQSPLDLDATIQDIANLLTPPNEFYPGPHAEATPYAHDNSYPSIANANMCYENQQNQVYAYNNNNQRVDNFYPNNLLPSGAQNPNTLYAGGTHEDINSEIHTDAYLDSILNSECFKMMDANNNQSSTTAQQHGNPMDCSGSNGAKSSDKPPNASSSSGGGNGNAVNFLDLSCGSAGSSLGSLGSESLPSSSDGEWGEGSDPGNDYRRSNFYGPYDYSSNNSSNFTIRQMPVAQKKYHMFGKRYLQEEISNNTLTDSRARTLQSGSPTSDLDEKENSTYDDFEEEMKVHANLKNISKLIKTERDKFQRSDQNLVRHNHTYALSHSPDSNQSNDRDGSEYDDGPSEQGHLTRDEKRARNLNVPIPVYDIINLPMDEFNERVAKYDLSENQLSLIRDIRRRGKNKVAAQNCRKRKLDTILSLESEVEEVRRRKEKLHNEKEYVAMEKKRIASKFATLHKHIFHYLKDDDGMPCSPSKFSLQQSADGSMYLLPRDNSKQDPNCYSMSLLMSEASTSSVCRERSRMKESSFGRTGADESHSITEL